MKTLQSFGLTILVLVFAFDAATAQGPLAPPGPPGETMRSLDQIEPRTPIGSIPFTITQPGSYYLTGNVAGITAGAVAGIVVAASNVRLDLNGFTLTGNPAVAAHGIFVEPGAENVKLYGGGIAHWGSDGVHAPEAAQVALDRLVVQDCGGHGIVMASGSLGDITSENNGGAGVFQSNPVPGIGIIVKKNPGGSSARLLNNAGGGLVLEGDCDIEFSGEIRNNANSGIAWTPTVSGHTLRLRLRDLDVSGHTGNGLDIVAANAVEVACDFAHVSFEHNTGKGVFIQLSNPTSRLDIVHRGGRVSDNGGDGLDLTAGLSGNQGFRDLVLARNGGDGCNKVDGGSNPGTFQNCVIQDNLGRGLDLVGGTWTLENSVVKGNGSDGVVVAAKKEFKGHVSLLKRGGAVENNAGDGIRVQPFEDDADCSVVVENSRCSGNTGDGLHVVADRPGSGGSVRVLGSSASGNGKSGIAIGSVVGSIGLAYQIGDNDCDGNAEDGITILDPRMTGGTVRHTRLSGNTGNGLSVEGGMVTLEACEIRRNGGDGVVLAAKKHTKTGHVSLLKRGGASEDNAGSGLRVFASEAEAECRVVVDHSSCSGNSSNGLHVVSDLPGSSITLDWLDSFASGNGGSGLLINPIAMDKGLRFHVQGGACDNNGVGGLTVAGDAVDVCTVRGLSLRGNGTWGARAAGGSWLFEDCVAADNPEGGFRMHKPMAVYKRSGSFAFQDCAALDNGLAGIAIYEYDATSTARVDIAGGQIAANDGTGIDLSSSPGTKGRIHGVTVADNTGHGIYSEGSDWSITDNRVAGNANTGIFVAGNGHHVARNELAGNALGIYLEGAGSAARENTFSGMAPGGGALQTPYVDNSGANAVAPVQNVLAGVNPLGNVEF